MPSFQESSSDTCQRCGSSAVAFVHVPHKDCFYMSLFGKEYEGYGLEELTPLAASHEDNTEFEFCMDCGQLQGDFPQSPLLPVDPDRTITCDGCGQTIPGEDDYLIGESCLEPDCSGTYRIVETGS